MCGISGTVGIADRGLIESMNSAQRHRGPDGAGIELFAAENGAAPAALGHRRLSIIDPHPRGAQPMADATGRYWLTFNGEIYNYPELRTALERQGVRFRTDTDTEVLVELFARRGADMLGELNGMFAFGIWDSELGELFLARDRLGVKPLYYSLPGETLVFASEVKAILKAIPPPSLSPGAIADFLTFLWVPDPDTLMDGIHKLPPGHFATFARGRLSIQEYWDLDFAVDRETRPDEWPERVREVVQAAVRRQMISDVPLGGFLSGGVDSGAVVATMCGERESVSTYTVGFSSEDLAHEIVPDDLRYSRELAARFGLDYSEQILAPDIVDLLPRLISHHDDPVADPATITTYLICSAASEKLTVILSGMGGDEIFAGYPRHLAAKLTRPAGLLPAQLRGALRRSLEGRLTVGKPGRLRGPRRNLMKLLRGIDQGPIERYLTYSSYYRDAELDSLLSPSLRSALGSHDPFRHHRRLAARVDGEHWLNQLLYLDAKMFLPCLNLSYTDKLSMAASTEVRVPLIDDEVVRLAMSLPPELKLRRLQRKYIFKKAMEGILPDEVIWRPKAGFGAPLRAWIGKDLRPMVDDLLSPAAIGQRGLFEPTAVRRLITDNDAGVADNALQIWALLVLELWHQEFVDRPTSRSELP